MGARIEAIASRRGRRRGLLGAGATALAVAAARRALAAAGRAPADVDLLIYSGVYRDDNVCEPAIAPFVQKRLGLRPRFPAPAGEPAFAFDVINGAVGVANATEVAEQLLGCGAATRALVVVSDVDPTPRFSQGADFDPVGAALLLVAGDEGEGFEAFHTTTFSKYAHLREARVDFFGRGPSRRRAHHGLVVREGRDFAARLLDGLERATSDLLAQRGLAWEDVDLVVPTAFPPELPSGLAERLGLSAGRVWSNGARLRAPATSALLALGEAMASPAWERARRVLWVSAGAGVTISLALYRKPAKP
jgi:3-oxoacyl-[acyl-carrier-protein] synthase III